jgi:hypothetical protein
VLKRVGQEAASNVDELTPRRWKTQFAGKLLHPALYDITAWRNLAAESALTLQSSKLFARITCKLASE